MGQGNWENAKDLSLDLESRRAKDVVFAKMREVSIFFQGRYSICVPEMVLQTHSCVSKVGDGNRVPM